MLWLSSTILLIPVCTTLMRVFECASEDEVLLQSTQRCDGLAVTLLRVVGGVCTVAFVAFAACSTYRAACPTHSLFRIVTQG